MSANQLPTVTDSFVEVSIASMEQLEAGATFTPVLDRLSKLKLAGDARYLQLPEYLGSACLLAGDFEPQITADSHLREIIIARGTEIRHYVVSLAKAEAMLVKSELPVRPGTTQVAFSPDMPPVLAAAAADYSVVNRITGRNYDQRVLRRALHWDMAVASEYADAFLTDTAPFLNAVIETEPKVNIQKQ